MFMSFQMDEALDRWITGNYGEDSIDDGDGEEEDVFDPRYDEPLDFGEE